MPGRFRARITGLAGLLVVLLAGLWLAFGAAAPTHAPALLSTATPPAPTPPPAATATPLPPTTVALVPATATLPPPTVTPVPPTATAPPPTATLPPPSPTAPPASPTAPPLPSATPVRAARAQPPTPSPAPVTPRPVARSVSTPAPPHPVTVYAPGVYYGNPRPPTPSRIVHISSPDIQLNTGVIEVYVVNGLWQVADYAAGHHWTSANPGEGGNIVITGHNNWRGEVFRYLEFLQIGNEIDLTTADGRQWRYRVTQMQKLPEKNVSLTTQEDHAHVMDPTPYERLTLITCWPYTTYTHRLVIYAMPAGQ